MGKRDVVANKGKKLSYFVADREHTLTHNRLIALCPKLPRASGTRTNVQK